MLPRQARSISTIRSFSAARRRRANSDCFVNRTSILVGWAGAT
jgi:hypothetical protein